MKKGNYRVVLSIFFVSSLLALTGCPESKEGKVTGGGWIIGQDGVGKASFGFNANGCPAEEGETKIGYGHFTYHDKGARVKIQGWITKACQCVDGGSSPNVDDFCAETSNLTEGFVLPYYAFKLETDLKNASTGTTATVFVQANDEGADVVNNVDYIRVVTDKYRHGGHVQGGNIQSHTCDDDE